MEKRDRERRKKRAGEGGKGQEVEAGWGVERTKGKMHERTDKCPGHPAGSAPGPGDAEMVKDTDPVRTSRSKQNMAEFLTLIL